MTSRILAFLSTWYSNTTPRARLLLGLVATVGLGTLAAIVVLLHSSLSDIAAKTDQIDMTRGHELIQASLESSLAQMTDVTTDNAIWDDAAENLYSETFGDTFPQEIWGTGSAGTKPYDGAYVLDEHFNVLWGRHLGQPDLGIEGLGDGLTALIAAHRQDIETQRIAVSGLSFTEHGPAIVSIGLIRPLNGQWQPPGEMRRYLVMTQHITAPRLARQAHIFRVEDLALRPAGTPEPPFLNLLDAAGRPVAQLSWKPRLSGAVTAGAARSRVEQVSWLAGVLVLVFIAITAFSMQKLAQSENEARKFAMTDGLSGLPNRRALFELLSNASRTKRGHKTVVFIDLDGFKDVNDIYGHNTGDKLIMIVAAALKGFLPAKAMLARIGGDEFAMLIGGGDGPAKAQAFADAALAYLSAPIRIGDITVQIGASIGIADAELKSCSSQELLRRADMAMYHSKASGKGRITHYDADLDAARHRKQGIEKDIRAGLARGEFDVVYQPIVDTWTHRITSVEALVRWPRRPAGPLGPDQFIDIAEASGLIHQLGQFVLKRACSDLRDRPDLRLSVNISPAQFRDPLFEHKVSDVLKETGFPVERLELEVTEGYLIENPDRAIAAVRNLKALGVSLALDDFGTGYASVGYLRRFQFDRIKIDRSLAGRVDTDPQAAALVAGTVSIAHALSIAITAEGVETAEQAKLLKLAGCHRLQGFYFGRPQPLANVIETFCEPAAGRVSQAS